LVAFFNPNLNKEHALFLQPRSMYLAFNMNNTANMLIMNIIKKNTKQCSATWHKTYHFKDKCFQMISCTDTDDRTHKLPGKSNQRHQTLPKVMSPVCCVHYNTLTKLQKVKQEGSKDRGPVSHCYQTGSNICNWLSWGLTSHSTQSRSYQRRSFQPISWPELR